MPTGNLDKRDTQAICARAAQDWTAAHVNEALGEGAAPPPSAAALTAGSLVFDAEFESANLRRAVQVGPRQYLTDT